jgi:hypothetical protein
MIKPGSRVIIQNGQELPSHWHFKRVKVVKVNPDGSLEARFQGQLILLKQGEYKEI